jgi:glycosyltransferase involved in cell wall biosynthesis
MRISLFYPAFNEEANISKAVEIAGSVLGKLLSERKIEDYEIIVIDDGSADRTGTIADKLAGQDQRVKVVHHKINLGYGAALWSGLQAAQYEWVFFTDADLQFSLDEIGKLLEFTNEYKAIIGYRAPRRDSLVRLINAKGWNILNRILFGLKVRDIDCAFKLLDRRLVAELPLETRGATMSAEMLIRLQRKGIRFKEVPVTHLPRTKGRATGARLSVIIRAFRELFALYGKIYLQI